MSFMFKPIYIQKHISGGINGVKYSCHSLPYMSCPGMHNMGT